MEVSIATPDGVVFQGNADDVLLQGHEGQINILEGTPVCKSCVRFCPVSGKLPGSTVLYATPKTALR